MPTDEDRRSLYSHLREYGRFTGLWWIMTPEPEPPKPLPIPAIEEVILSEEFLCIEGLQNQIAHVKKVSKSIK